MSLRSRSRLWAVQGLYQYKSMRNVDIRITAEQLYEQFISFNSKNTCDSEYFRYLLSKSIKNAHELALMLSAITNLNALDLTTYSILICGICELQDLHKSIVINEYINIAQGLQSNHKQVNLLLDKIDITQHKISK